jgi:hypothetical protein
VNPENTSIFEKIVFQKIAFFMEFCVKMKKFRPIKCVLFLHCTHKKKYGLGEFGKKCSDPPLENSGADAILM